MSKNITSLVQDAIEKAPFGMINLELLKNLRLCDDDSLKTTLSRLNKAGKIIRLKRGLYSANPIKDAFATGQGLFNGYLGFTSALYLHKLISEVPFRITIVTINESQSKSIGTYEFKSVALHEKAVGFERLESYNVSTRAKTLFDCLYLKAYSIEEKKLIQAFKDAKLSELEWKEFDMYVKKFLNKKKTGRFEQMKKTIRG